MHKHDMPSQETARLVDFLPAVICLCLSAIVLIFLNFKPTSQNKLAAVFPPGFSQEMAFLSVIESGAYVTGNGRFDNIIHLQITEPEKRDMIIKQLKNNGAWAVINPVGAIGCFASSRPQQKIKV